MTVLGPCMFALLGVSVALIVKQWKSDFLPLVRIAVLIGLGMVILASMAPLVTYLQGLIAQSGMQSTHGEILFKALGIALLTQCCADICRESGENGAASTVELTGKVEILLLCLPLLEEILSAARTLLSLGG